MKFISIEAIIFNVLIFILLFLLFRWINARYIKKGKIWFPLIISIFLTPILYFMLIIGIFSILDIQRTTGFQKEVWFSNKNERWRMGKELVESKALMGLDSNAVKEKIGNATTQEMQNKKWSYDLGSDQTGFGLTFYYLNITFKNNNVDNAEFLEIKD